MSRLITLSRAARLVGVKRGTLQKKIQQGELRTFEGELLLSDLLHAYPQTEVEDTSMLDRVETIMEQAVNKIIRPQEDKPDADMLAARILSLGSELAKARQEARRNGDLIENLRKKFAELSADDDTSQGDAFSSLRDWFFQTLRTLEITDDDSGIIAKEALLRVMGNCGQCKCKVVSGQVKKIAAHDYVLTEAEKGLGYILACSNTAVTDVVLEADEALGAHDIPHQEIEIKVKKVEQPDDRIIVLHAKTPRTRRLRFLAGQYLSIELDGQQAQDCSIASCPCDDMNLQFHIPVVAGNPFTGQLVDIKANGNLTIRGPSGEFTLDEDSPRSLVFIAVNAGFGPVKSLIEHAMALDIAEELRLYWITTPDNSHYLGNLCRSWDDALDNFRYTPLQATDTVPVEALLPGILAELEDIEGLDFYACVPAPLREPVENCLREHGVSAARIRLEQIRQDPSG
jgi:CDP-4-dehydro-6-deoxyglucose reductase